MGPVGFGRRSTRRRRCGRPRPAACCGGRRDRCCRLLGGDDVRGPGRRAGQGAPTEPPGGTAKSASREVEGGNPDRTPPRSPAPASATGRPSATEPPASPRARARAPGCASAGGGSLRRGRRLPGHPTAPKERRRGLRDLPSSFVRAPAPASSDPVWSTLRSGRPGRVDVTLAIDDEGQAAMRALRPSLPRRCAAWSADAYVMSAVASRSLRAVLPAGTETLRMAVTLTQILAQPVPECGGRLRARLRAPRAHH